MECAEIYRDGDVKINHLNNPGFMICSAEVNFVLKQHKMIFELQRDGERYIKRVERITAL